MDGNTTQIKVTIPKNAKVLLQEKASQLGLSLSGYVKLLINSDIKDSAYPVYTPTVALDDKVEEAIKLSKENKLGSFGSIEELNRLIDDSED